MKFMLTFAFAPQTRDEAIIRFRKTGGQPPAGAKLLARSTAADFSRGYALLESDDTKALTEFSLAWSDVVQLQVVPVLEDSELNDALRRAAR